MALDVNRVMACLCLGVVLVAETVQIMARNDVKNGYFQNQTNGSVTETVYTCNLISASLCAFVILMRIFFVSRVSRIDWMWFEHLCIEVPILVMLIGGVSYLASMISGFVLVVFVKFLHESALSREHEIFQVELENENISINKTTTVDLEETSRAVVDEFPKSVKLTTVDRVWPISLTAISTIILFTGVWYPIWLAFEALPMAVKKVALIHFVFQAMIHFMHMIISIMPSRSAIRSFTTVRGQLPFVHIILATTATISSTYVLVLG